MNNKRGLNPRIEKWVHWSTGVNPRMIKELFDWTVRMDRRTVNVANKTVYTPYRHNPDATDPCNSAVWRKENLQFWYMPELRGSCLERIQRTCLADIKWRHECTRIGTAKDVKPLLTRRVLNE